MELVTLKYHHTISCPSSRHVNIESFHRIAIAAIVCIIASLCVTKSYATIIQTTDTISVSVHFPQAHSNLDSTFMDNGANLRDFANVYHTLACDSAHINIYGYASPEGSIQINKTLSQRRADAIADYLIDELMVDPHDITKIVGGVDWTGLYNAVNTDPDVPQRIRVLQIISTVGDSVIDSRGRIVSGRKQQLMKLDGGRPWEYMYSKIFPNLRGSYADVFCVLNTELLEYNILDMHSYGTEVKPMDVTLEVPSTMEIQSSCTISNKHLIKYPWIAFRTNLLLPLLNFGAELPIAKHWSIGADYYYPWIWPAKSNKNCFELTIFSCELRYWFCPDKSRELRGRNYLQGHSIGAYGAWGYYDFEHNYKGHQGNGWSCGIDYLYSLPIARDRLRLEFQAAFGMVWSNDVQPYTVYESGGHLIRDIGIKKNYSYFGPTKIAISIVLPLFHNAKSSTSSAK